MIEVKVDKRNPRRSAQLIVDGIVINNLEGLDISIEDEVPYKNTSYRVFAYTERASRALSTQPFSGISESISLIILELSYDLLDDPQIFHQVTVHRIAKGQFHVSLRFDFADSDWKRLWSISEYENEFRVIFKQQHLTNISWTQPSDDEVEGNLDELELSFAVQDVDATIEEEAWKHSDELRRLHELTEAALISKLRSDSVVLHFDFPEEVKIPCEQYLLYFAQFLRDLGVEADTALTHEAGQALFTVTPKDKQTALDKIHNALKLYLRLPSSPVSDTTNEAIAIQRLESNVLRLRSDLKLAAAELQAKNATVQAQQLTISIQQGLLSGEIVFDSMKDVTPKSKDTEDLLGGMLSLKKYEGKGFDVDLPEMFRRFKKLFSEKDEE